MDGRLKTFVLKPLIILGLIACSFAALAQRPQDPRQPNRPVPDDVRTKGPEPVARLTPEEYLIRDVYARLMRYQFAAVQAHQADTGVPAGPDAYLVVALRNVRAQAWAPRIGQATAEAKPDRTLALHKIPLCRGLDPCHVYYDVEWATTGSGAGRRLEQPPGGTPSRYTTYRVALTLGTTNLNYSAAAYHYEAGAGTSVTRIVDPAIPDLDGLVNERSPLAVAPWSQYVTTPRYAAVVSSMGPRGLQVSVPENAPIGWLPGDDVADPSGLKLGSSAQAQAFDAPAEAVVCCQDPSLTNLVKEYVTYGLNWHPQCSDFYDHLPVPSEVSQYYSFGQFHPDSSYAWVLYQHQVLENVVCIANALTDSPRQIESGYRNPQFQTVHHPGSPNSRHVYGDAVDLIIQSNTIFWQWHDVAKSSCGFGCVEPRGSTPTWMHVDYQPGQCPPGW